MLFNSFALLLPCLLCSLVSLCYIQRQSKEAEKQVFIAFALKHGDHMFSSKVILKKNILHFNDLYSLYFVYYICGDNISTALIDSHC